MVYPDQLGAIKDQVNDKEYFQTFCKDVLGQEFCKSVLRQKIAKKTTIVNCEDVVTQCRSMFDVMKDKVAFDQERVNLSEVYENLRSYSEG